MCVCGGTVNHSSLKISLTIPSAAFYSDLFSFILVFFFFLYNCSLSDAKYEKLWGDKKNCGAAGVLGVEVLLWRV